MLGDIKLLRIALECHAGVELFLTNSPCVFRRGECPLLILPKTQLSPKVQIG